LPWACRARGKEDKCVESFGRKIEDTTKKHRRRQKDGTKMDIKNMMGGSGLNLCGLGFKEQWQTVVNTH
jgi:hypothetical protein